MRRLISFMFVFFLLASSVFAYNFDTAGIDMIILSQSSFVNNNSAGMYHVDTSFQHQMVGNLSSGSGGLFGMCHGFYCIFEPVLTGTALIGLAITLLVLSPLLFFVFVYWRLDADDLFRRIVLEGVFLVPLVTLVLFFLAELVGVVEGVLLVFYRLFLIVYFLIVVNNFFRLVELYINKQNDKKYRLD